MSPRAENTAAIKREARAIGFDKVGIALAGDADPQRRLAAWLARGFHGDMDYMANSAETRVDPSRWVEGVRSVIVVAISYYRPDSSNSGVKIARYARGADYHRFVRRKLLKLRKFVLSLDPEAIVAPSIDFAPVMERAWAERAGVAWIGKSTMAIAPDLGTYTFLATLMTNLELDPDPPLPDRCGSCTACLDSCPTGAFVGPHQLDARRCITYWTVEKRGDFGPETPPLHGWLAGCDVCQEVCPWNKFKKPAADARFEPRVWPDLITLAQDRAAAEKAIEGTALMRTGPDAIQRSARRLIEEG